ncbi:thymidylate synthase [Paenibacillus sp. FSL R7-0302]|uniref:thymidylate synthase n=1 Tax=Paenibacillus sp. FSL R7-0302 TaxID=2921681 RepID=UPI0030F90B84
MSFYDKQYKALVQNIVQNGYSDKGQNVRTVWADGTPAHTLSTISEKLVFDCKEVPILTTKRVAWKSAIHELLWFYVHRTSKADYLDENNVKIWREWTRSDNTIGRAYGYQLGKPIRTGNWKVNPVSGHVSFEFTNQVERLIQGLINDPASRRHIITLNNIDDAWDMALQPCVWHNQWLVKNGKLHLIVGVRSNDVALGQPFNVFQYYVLLRMIAQITGYEVGTVTFNINDCHIYDRHIDPLLDQIELEGFKAPELWINPDVKNFDDFTIDDFKLIGYEHHPSIKMEVAI